MAALVALSALFCVVWCLCLHTSVASEAQFVLYGGNLLTPSYYYQLQLTQNKTVILELRDADYTASRASLDEAITKVRQRAPTPENWIDVTQFDGNLVDEKNGIIGRLNCQFRSWTCEEDQAMVMKLAADAEVVDHTYTGDLNPRFQIAKDALTPGQAWYDFSFKVKDSRLLSSPQYATVAEAKASIEVIQAGNYTWESRTVPVGPVMKLPMVVLVDSAHQTLATVGNGISMVGFDLATVKATVQKLAPSAHVDVPAFSVLV